MYGVSDLFVLRRIQCMGVSDLSVLGRIECMVSVTYLCLGVYSVWCQ